MIGGRHWIGGYNYLLNLFRVLREYGSGHVQPVLFVGEDFSAADLAPFVPTGYDIIRSSALNTKRQYHSLASALLIGRDRAVEHTFRAHNINVVFEVANFHGWRFELPVVAWIPDFQHRHLSYLFSKRAYWRREFGLRAQIGWGRTIMLSSEDARKSCEQFYPSSTGRTRVVHFGVHLDDEMFDVDPQKVRLRYGLPERYIYLPNQFWSHKNHRVVIESLALLPDANIVVATTGQGTDPRHPALQEELRHLVCHFGLQEQFRFIGTVPYVEVIALMRGATAVLNPSLFEGWSTTVEEARALGVPLILSDIAVHREQMGEMAQYFQPDSPRALATILQAYGTMSQSNQAGREAVTPRKIELLCEFARNLETVFTQAVGS